MRSGKLSSFGSSNCPNETGGTWRYVAEFLWGGVKKTRGWIDAGNGLQIKCAREAGICI